MSKSRIDFACLLAAFLFALSTISTARADETPPKPSAPKAETNGEVPLSRVVLFNSGVGFFDRRGEVKGDARVELKFNVEDINDLLKSMVLQDLGGGKISAVTYGSKDPITKTLKTFAVDLTDNPTLGEILNQVRGERVEVSAPNPITGIILGVEKHKKPIGRDSEPVEVEILNLLTDEGLRSVPMDSVGSIKLLSEKLDKDFRQALKVLAMGHDTDKKSVTLNFLGDGKRQVRVGYIQQAPIWKTSYRLVLKEGEAPFLQGWAIVENTTEEDWNKVNLTLVSGRPISFIMDLYQPLYVQRPVVAPELFASLRPQTYGQDLAKKDADFKAAAANAPRSKVARAAKQLDRRSGLRGDQSGPKDEASLEGGEAFGYASPTSEAEVVAMDNLTLGVQSLSQAANVGELFQYEIATPVTLPRQESAMLPIVNQAVKGTKLSIYNPAVQAKHPLNGLRLVNATDLHLMQGPITVFDGGAYAGDAKIEDMQPGTDRLISYALDLDTEVAPETIKQPTTITSVKLVKGLLYISHKQIRTQKYTVKNSGKKAKTVLIEYPLEANWKLVTPKEPTEKTRDLYRFAIEAEPGKPAMLEVTEEQVVQQQIALNNIDDNTIQFYLNQKVISDKVKVALQEIIKRKTQLAKVVQEKQQFEQQVAVIDQEQSRIRQNMAQLDHTTDLYKRYVKKFGDQETAVEELRGKIQTQTAEETKLRKQLDEYLLGLDLS